MWTEDNSNVLMVVIAVISLLGSAIGGAVYYNVNESNNRIEMKELENDRLDQCFDIGDESERLLCTKAVLGD